MQPIQSEFVDRVRGGLSRQRAAITAALTPVTPPAVAATEIGIPGPPVPAAASPSRTAPDSMLGAAVGIPGAARRTRLALDPAARAKLERLESSAAAARAEVFRLGDLIDGERRRLVELDQQYASWERDYRIDKSDIAALQAERTTCDEELARLTARRDAAQERWQRLGRLCERCRLFVGLPASGGRS